MATIYARNITIEINGHSFKAFEEELAQALDKIPNRLKTIEGEFREVEPSPEAKLLNLLSSPIAKKAMLTPEEVKARLEQFQNPT